MPSSPLKPDAERIARYIDWLVREQRRKQMGDRAYWPRYLFHVTDVNQAASIIAAGRLLSRAAASDSRMLVTDNASPEIIAQTDPEIHRYVRLYFRPRTPTFFHNEGIRPVGQRSMNSHCPVPVALLFDAKTVLGMSGSRFSNGNLARRGQATLGQTASFFENLPFDDIYHDQSLAGYSQAAKDSIVFRRQAEVVIPNELPLQGNLHSVFLRSAAERETLLSLLAEINVALPLPYPVRINVRQPLFFKRWSFVETVSLRDHQLTIQFNPSSETPGPFSATFEFFDPLETLPQLSQTVPEFQASGTYGYELPQSYRNRSFIFRIRLDGCLAYQNEIRPTDDVTLFDIPF